MTTDERAYYITDRIFWIMVENTHPSNLGDYIEPDPNNPEGTRNTERGQDEEGNQTYTIRGQELFEELKEFVRNTIWVVYITK